MAGAFSYCVNARTLRISRSRTVVNIKNLIDDLKSVLYPLTDDKPRKDENLERGYLQGRYGAIPFLGNFRVNGE